MITVFEGWHEAGEYASTNCHTCTRGVRHNNHGYRCDIERAFTEVFPNATFRVSDEQAQRMGYQPDEPMPNGLYRVSSPATWVCKEKELVR